MTPQPSRSSGRASGRAAAPTRADAQARPARLPPALVARLRRGAPRPGGGPA